LSIASLRTGPTHGASVRPNDGSNVQ